MPLLLLFPPLGSRILLKQGQSIQFFVWTDDCIAAIQLWSNINDGLTWQASPFGRCTQEGWYSLVLSSLLCGQYEFTLRYYRQNGQEIWLGTQYNNGVVSIVANKHPIKLPCMPVDTYTLVHSTSTEESKVGLYRVKKRLAGKQTLSLCSITSVSSYMALAQKSACWMVPVAGLDYIEEDERPWHLFVWQSSLDASVTVWIVVTCYGQDGYLKVKAQQNGTYTLCIHTIVPDDGNYDEMHSLTLLYGVTTDTTKETLDQLIHKMLNELTVTPNQKSTIDQPVTYGSSVMENYIGFCTWNAFGKNVNMEAIGMALTSFEEHGIPVRYLMIDDGWQQQRRGYLTGFDTDKSKFRHKLKTTITLLKTSHLNLLAIGVWHTLWGYWKGIDPDYSKHTLRTEGFYCHTADTDGDGVYLIDNISQFYDLFYQYLANAGVDYVKIDNQGAINDLVCLHRIGKVTTPISIVQRHDLWKLYFSAARRASNKYFTAIPSIFSMAMTPMLTGSLKMVEHSSKSIFLQNPILRNSDDYFPDVYDSHPWHIYTNLLNILWSTYSSFMLDFDMFQSDHPYGAYHAASRAISGGPIYVTDEPGHHNLSLLRSLVAQHWQGDYRILRCKQHCWPFNDTIIGGKPIIHQDYISAWNTNGNKGYIYGYWSMLTQTDDMCIATAFVPSGFVGYITWGMDKGNVFYQSITPSSPSTSSTKLHQTESRQELNGSEMPFRLHGGGGYTLINVAPVHFFSLPPVNDDHDFVSGGIACIGLLDKMNGLQAVIKTELLTFQGQQICKTTTMSNKVVLKAWISHRSSQCGFFLSLSSSVLLSSSRVPLNVCATARINDIDVKLNQLDNTASVNEYVSVWTIDMMRAPLPVSSYCGFVAELHVTYI